MNAFFAFLFNSFLKLFVASLFSSFGSDAGRRAWITSAPLQDGGGHGSWCSIGSWTERWLLPQQGDVTCEAVQNVKKNVKLCELELYRAVIIAYVRSLGLVIPLVFRCKK